ncbi:hypothetical protein AGMMS49928_16320 [Spirochaetia bacterium]|nr:hypothetical protein AGMMS49928_16320 [Spirochaetia bacterium]
MATAVKRIEKEFLLKVLYDEQQPLVYLRNRKEYNFVLEKPVKGDEIFLLAQYHFPALKAKKRMSLAFDYRGALHSFSTEVISVRDDHITVKIPERLYKDLDRSYSRVAIPPDLRVQFTFLEDRYSLSYPRVNEYEKSEMSNFMKQKDLQNLSGIIQELAAWVKTYASGHKMVLFRNGVKPSTLDERIIAELGKILFLPNTGHGLPLMDPYPKKRLVTDAMFKRYLESAGTDLSRIDAETEKFLKSKRDQRIVSDVWVPVLFQEYVIGYIHIWLDRGEEKTLLDFGVIDTLSEFAKIVAFSLKTNGFFDTGLIKNEPFEGQVIDISASGILFAYPHSHLSAILLEDSDLAVKLVTPKRSISTKAHIVRHFKDPIMNYYGCHFSEFEPDDIRDLFEYIYGKPFTEQDAQFLAGQV